MRKFVYLWKASKNPFGRKNVQNKRHSILDYLLKPALAPLLLYRRIRYGYAFRIIPLTKGKFARVDPADYPRLLPQKARRRRAEELARRRPQP